MIFDIVKDNNNTILIKNNSFKNYRKVLNSVNLNYDMTQFRQQSRLRGKNLKVVHILDNRDDIKLKSIIQINPTSKAYK